MAHVLPPAPPPMHSAANTRQEPMTVGAQKVVAEGVPAAVRPDPQTGDGRYPIAWLTITAPRGAVPTVTSVCECGRNLFATGHHKALALIEDHTDHRTHCPLRTDQEGTAA
ncbi:hypothetical protein OG909_16260 [Streptomyces sp. NBC_01754]|uniref:hypothetical protein n=1 Tax=Streptomyces sp. NBC_01754 TaxID=2975930 RepID=UPI002DD8C6ED|nr:hypothetical protein [Streptomyces sp. NBC_01754]WSC93707.1 hypothetical protein OG909_16260 [Streptomyces sp. NBC_01754]